MDTVSAEKLLNHYCKIDCGLFHMANSTAIELRFDYLGYRTYFRYLDLMRFPNQASRLFLEEALDFEEKMLWMRDGNGPVWG